jgi:hypothetical protein
MPEMTVEEIIVMESRLLANRIVANVLGHFDNCEPFSRLSPQDRVFTVCLFLGILRSYTIKTLCANKVAREPSVNEKEYRQRLETDEKASYESYMKILESEFQEGVEHIRKQWLGAIEAEGKLTH